SMTTEPAQTWGRSVFRSLVEIFTSSVRVPVPVALGLLLLFGAAVFFLRPAGPVNVAQSTPLSSSPAPETRTVTVPVVKEKVITRVVYLEKKGRRFRNSAPAGSVPSSLSDSVARARSDASLGSLAGFKPTDQIRLTITKGSDRDEK
ncbi:MAG TPA: hypothetical protein VMS31_17740, partial [Pyrinomonadaceae bacterium]|nr:hypothetical protein [Pyrinomonadaceae bacterium]